MHESEISDASSTSPRVSLGELSSFLEQAGIGVRLVDGASGRSPSEILVEHLTEDSRKVRAGSLFVARVGGRSDGTQFIASAKRAGATAVLIEGEISPDGQASAAELSVAAEPAVPCLLVDDLRSAWGRAAHLLWGQPTRTLRMIGITGTNGKTTIATLVTSALGELGHSVVQGGTLGFFLNGRKLGDSLTTPMPDQLAERLAEAASGGAQFGVLEVSSHALDQRRTAGISWDVVAFSNLSQDHLDYHGTMEAYGEAKARLFEGGSELKRVLNIDDAWGRVLAERHAQALLVGVRAADSAAPARPSDRTRHRVEVSSLRFSEQGIEATLSWGGRQERLRSGLLGRHNLENLLVSLGVLLELGFGLEESVRALGSAAGVPGRLERCEGPADDVVVVVDYAHTPDALERVLLTLGELDFPELVCVFGCGGDRDRTKRPLMGAAAARGASRAVVTSDNPRSEDPDDIIREILPGLGDQAGRGLVEVDRRRAIERAVCEARPGACILIAGKGHEDYQLIGEQVLHFDDREEAARALEKRRALAASAASAEGQGNVRHGD